MARTMKSHIINAQAVDEISDSVSNYLAENKVSREMATRVRLCVEEMLLAIMTEFESKQEAELILSRRLGRQHIVLRYKSRKFNPIEGGLGDEVSELVLNSLGINPTYSYRTGVNKITFSLPRAGIRQEAMLGIAVVLAAVMGLTAGVIPAGVKDAVSSYLLTPIADSFMKLLMIVAPILIFLSITTGINKSTSDAEFGRMSRYIIGRYLLLSTLACAVFTSALIVFFNFEGTSGTGSGSTEGFMELYAMLLDIIPGNLILPFAEGNMMQIIFIAILLGSIILGLDNKADNLKKILTDTHNVFSSAMEIVCGLLPIFIFASLTKLFWENGLSTFRDLWKPIVVGIAAEAIMCAIQLVRVCVKFGTKPAVIMKKIREAFIIAVTTGSSMAAYTKGVEASKKNMGMDPKYADIAYPLGLSLCTTNYIPLFVIMPFYLAEVYHVAVSPVWFIKAAIIIFLVTYASPQVSGGAMVCLSILFTQLGIPLEGLGLAGVIATVMDFPSTAAKLVGQVAEMTVQADHLGMLDVSILRDEGKI